MHVSRVILKNYRNYQNLALALSAGRNILVGENAQGKTNFLEAIELLATGRAPRACRDYDLICWQPCGAAVMQAELEFVCGALSQESLRVAMGKAPGAKDRVEKHIAVNGVKQRSLSDLVGRLLVVSFASYDLNLLRGGPRFRRDWLDTLVLKLRPALAETYTNYGKNLAQRNRLLKSMFEKGKVTVSDQDQLVVWDKQVATLGARIIKQRLAVLDQLTPLALEHQMRLSRESEALSIKYLFKAMAAADDALLEEETPFADKVVPYEGNKGISASELSSMDELELAKLIFQLLKERRGEEIRRKQTTVGPHRDDLQLCLNDVDAVSFGSQGQQRSIVLSLKMGEVELIRGQLNDSPVLLLDDVLAELDEFRQGLLMSVVSEGLQTIITTTHVSGFDRRWLDGATIFQVCAGAVAESEAGAAPAPLRGT